MSFDRSLETRFPLPVLDFARSLERQLALLERHVRNLVFSPLTLPVCAELIVIVGLDNQCRADFPLTHFECDLPRSRRHRHPP